MLSFEKDGMEIRRALLTHATMASVKGDIYLDSNRFKKYGVRNLEKRFSSISRLAKDDQLLSMARDFLGCRPSLVRALFFDKTPDKNWNDGSRRRLADRI